MRLNLVRLLTALLVFFGLMVGGKGVLTGLSESAHLDNEYRFFAGVWLGVGCGLMYCLLQVRQCANFYFGLLGIIFIGGIARLIGMLDYGVVEPRIAVATAIEVVFLALIVWLQASIENQSTEEMHPYVRSASADNPLSVESS